MAQYEPTPDQEKLIAEVNSKYERWRKWRQPHEQQWFLNAAFLRGQHYVQWSAVDARLQIPPAPSHRVRLTINRIQAKARARRAKFLKNRPIPIVVGASPEHEDQLDARMTTKALEYQWDRLNLEKKYREALLWAEQTGRGYWWFYWDPAVMVRVKQMDPFTGAPIVEEAQLGDLGVEVGSPFEILVADPAAHSLALQPEIMRIKMRPIEEVKARYPEFAEVLVAEAGDQTAFNYERQISQLNATGNYGGAGSLEDRSGTSKGEEHTMVVMKEHFIKPCGKYPKGAYRLVAGSVLLISRDELPYGFHDLDNPYPVVEFVDIETVGQYFGTTIIEQMIPLQREYNLVRSKIAEQLRIMAFPKLLAARQHNIPDGAWTSEAGEFVEYLAIPGIPPPTPWHPPNIASDAWRAVDLIKTEFDDITQIYPAAEGKVAGATSGFQTNLLQEATDAVHGPDIRLHELTIEEAAQKKRRLMKLGYDVPRLLTIVGPHYEPEVIEFSEAEIDEHAKVRVQVGSMLPDLKAAKIQSGLELFKSGIMGDPADPAVRRRALSMIDAGSFEESLDISRADEHQAKLENDDFENDRPVADPEFFENHQTHYDTHTYKLKSPEARRWPPERRMALIAHTIAHVRFINPQSAVQLALQYGLIDPQTAALMAPPMGALPAAPAGAPGMGAAPQPPPPQESSQAQGPPS